MSEDRDLLARAAGCRGAGTTRMRCAVLASLAIHVLAVSIPVPAAGQRSLLQPDRSRYHLQIGNAALEVDFRASPERRDHGEVRETDAAVQGRQAVDASMARAAPASVAAPLPVPFPAEPASARGGGNACWVAGFRFCSP